MCLITNCQNPGSAKIKINKKYVPKNHQNPPKITTKLQKYRISFRQRLPFSKIFLGPRPALDFFANFQKSWDRASRRYRDEALREQQREHLARVLCLIRCSGMQRIEAGLERSRSCTWCQRALRAWSSTRRRPARLRFSSTTKSLRTACLHLP